MTTAAASVAIRRNQNIYRAKPELKLGPISATVLTIAVISVLALLYLNQITKTGVFGYQVSSLSHDRDTIAAAKQELEVEAARLQSIQQIKSSNVVAGMVPEGRATYVKGAN
jgi:hypothetical protein